MNMVEQVDKLIEDMKQLIDGLYEADNENIDFDQLREFSRFCIRYSVDVDRVIKNKEEV